MKKFLAKLRAKQVDLWIDKNNKLTYKDTENPLTQTEKAGLKEHEQKILQKLRKSESKEDLSKHPILTEAERHKILVEFNDTKADYPKNKCIHQLFEEQAKKTPDAIAVVFKDKQLNQRANQLGHYLQKLGVGAEVLVGVCVERSIEMIVGLLAILKAGGAYIPMDPEYPKDRIAFMMEDAQTPILLTQAKALDLPPESKRNVKSKVKSDNLVYMIYTSGSTGKPKGVMVRHNNVVNLLGAYEDMFSISDKPLNSTFICPFGFDVSVWEIFSCLCYGGALYHVPLEVLIDSEKFINVIKKNHITSAYIPPALLDDVGKKLEESPNNVKLNRMLVGVESIKQRTLQRFRNFSKKIKIINAYGPTETTVCSTFFDFYTEFETERKTPIGKAINNYEIYILDKNLQPVPIGVSGELHIAGAGLARGYLNRPKLTAEKFIPNPFDDDPNSRLYKTGDLAKWLPDGNIEFLGRIDHQVKIRGFRIELGEIESALLSHPAVKETVVVAIESMAGAKQLAAYIITKKQTDKNSEKNISELRSFLKAKLPDYMIPAFFVFIDAFPLTPNGKIDRKALPAPDLELMREHKFVAPRNKTEEIVAEIWKKILNIEKIGMYDNFFEMGGHSLLITQVISQAREALQVELAIYNLFDYPTIAMLAQYIETVDRQPDLRQTQNIQPVSRQQNLPLSSFQEQIWFLAQLYPNIPFYNECTVINITDRAFNIATMEQSLNEIIRTARSFENGFYHCERAAPAQNIMPPPTLNLRIFDLRKLPNQQREAEAIRLATKDAKRGFDLAGDILFRAFLARIDESQYSLYIIMHHIITDGISFSIFLKELSVLYKAFSAGKPSPLQDMPIQYADFA